MFVKKWKNETKEHKIERLTRLIAGALVMTGVFMGTKVCKKWHLFTLGIGFGLFHSGITDTCLVKKVLEKIYED